jgi:glycosyltransferase involved in cell wall biosynthesis
MMPCKVLHVIPALAPRYGGPSTAAVGMCRALIQAGVPALIATTDADGQGRLAVPTGQIESYAGVPVIFFPRVASESFKWSGPLEAWLKDHVRDFDLVHAHAVFSHSSLAAGRACQASGVPYVVRPLGTLDPWSLSRHRLRKRLLFRLGVRRLLAGAAALHYTSDEERRLAEAGLPWLPRGVVVPLGVEDELFGGDAGDRSGGAPILLVLSRLDAKKGIDLLIAAFHALAEHESCRAWTLVIAGDGDAAYVSSLRTLADGGAARDRIVFRGWVEGNDRHALFQQASLFALPSHQENFGIALVEAMANRVPAVVSPGVNLAADVEASGAGWVVTRDAAALREVLRVAMADRAELRRRGERARALAERFRWSAVGSRLETLYQQIVGAAAGTPVPTGALLAAAHGRLARNGTEH